MPNAKKSILQPKNDVVFKALFSRGKPRITQAMLEAILKMKIDKLELDKSTDLLNENADDKNGRLDLRAIINGNTECDIEVQLASNDNIAERFVYYWAKMYAANLKIGDTYSDLRKTISIIILDDDFKLTKNLEKPQTTWKIRESEATHLVLTDYFEIIIIEIPKVVKAYQKTPNDEVLQWMLFLDNPEKEEVARIMEENKDIKEAKEELERISQDDILRRKALNRTLEIADRLQLKKEAEEAFKKQTEIVDQVTAKEKTDKTVGFFYITSNGLVQVRQSSDYIPKMIELAGGKYIFENLGDSDSKRSTMNMQVEEFYNGAKDADFLIYNSTVDGGVKSINELVKKCPVLADFKAVKSGNVWCTERDVYQQSMSIGYLIEDIHNMLQGADDKEMNYLYRLN